MRFGISFLMGLVFLAAVGCGIARGSFIAFAIGFVAFGVLLMQLATRINSPAEPSAQETTGKLAGPWSSKTSSGQTPVVVCEMGAAVDAYMLRNYLVDRGVDAWVDGDQAIWVYPSLMQPRVLVRPDQLEQAKQALDDFAMRKSAEVGPSSGEGPC